MIKRVLKSKQIPFLAKKIILRLRKIDAEKEHRYLYKLSKNNTDLFITRSNRIVKYLEGIEERINNLVNSEYLISDTTDINIDDIIIDVGANIGEFSKFFNSKGYKVFSFEPDTIEFQALEKNVTNAFNFGLWNENTFLEFYSDNDTGDSGFIRAKSKYDKKYKMKVMRLSDFILSNHGNSGSSIGIIKVESEGAELEVLEGCVELLPFTKYITVDCGFERGFNSESTLPEVLNFLTQNGFEILKVSKSRLVILLKNRREVEKLTI